jgi:enamine deaminase RidA (YjgF/YER057c/UK114 family)
VTRPSARLAELGLTLPEVPTPLAAYRPAVRYGDLVFTAGQLPLKEGRLTAIGLVSLEVSVAEAAAAARTAALNAIAAAASVAGGIDGISAVVKAVVFVAGPPSFTEQPEVANGASELFEQVFGPAGRHARSSVGVAALPINAPVEVELVVAVGPTSAVDAAP